MISVRSFCIACGVRLRGPLWRVPAVRLLPFAAPCKKTARRMSGRLSGSRVEPVNRISPFSMNAARSASFSAVFTDCSTSTTVVPLRWIARTISSSHSTTVGARPSDDLALANLEVDVEQHLHVVVGDVEPLADQERPALGRLLRLQRLHRLVHVAADEAHHGERDKPAYRHERRKHYDPEPIAVRV